MRFVPDRQARLDTRILRSERRGGGHGTGEGRFEQAQPPRGFPKRGYRSGRSSAVAGIGVTFHMPGAVALSPATGIERWRPRTPLSRLFIVCTLGVAGSSSTVVTFYKNGASIGTETLVSTDQDQEQTIAVAFNGTSDYFYPRVTTAGTAAEGLLVMVTGE